MKGVSEMVNALKRIAEKFPDRVAAAIYLESQIEMTEAKKRTPVSPTAAQFRAMGRSMPKGLVPGTLRASGFVDKPARSGRNISVTLSFGGAAKDYAAVQHEDLTFHHTTGQARFLASTLEESRPYMAARIAARIKL